MTGEKVLRSLEENGFPAYFVGGCVRNSIMKAAVHDWDICTAATPEQIKACFSKTIDVGVRYGTVMVLTDEGQFEVTTFRSDGAYSDGRHPDSVTFTNMLTEDLRRRDFTMNAIAMDKDGRIFDPFDGARDIQERRIRAVDDPDKRFNEDALRILRALRFSATLGFAIEKETAAALFRQKQQLKNISAERIFSELKQLLMGINTGRVLLDYRDIIAQIIPELTPTFYFDQNNQHHIYDVYTHIVKTVENAPANEVLRLCMLLHDIAKPLCENKDSSGESHFYGHPIKSEEIARAVLSRLKCDKAAKNRILLLIREHDRAIPATRTDVKKVLKEFGTEFFEQLLQAKAADISAQAPAYTQKNMEHLQTLEALYTQILKRHECFSLQQLAVNGTDMIKIGLKGREIGKILQTLLTAVIDDILPNEKKALIQYAKFFQNNKNAP